VIDVAIEVSYDMNKHGVYGRSWCIADLECSSPLNVTFIGSLVANGPQPTSSDLISEWLEEYYRGSSIARFDFTFL
jgi:hypothetical protein